MTAPLAASSALSHKLSRRVAVSLTPSDFTLLAGLAERRGIEPGTYARWVIRRHLSQMQRAAR